MILIYAVLSVMGLCLATPNAPVMSINTPGVYQQMPMEQVQGNDPKAVLIAEAK